jgi:[ribosomal protein S5]-alanine N-acetyltransferase
LELIPVLEHAEENQVFTNNPICQDSIYMSIDFYKKVGFIPPWICYYVMENENLIGCAGFKGKPVNGQIEIAYGTFEKFRNQGLGTKICKTLVNLSLITDPTVRITARTLAENNFSTRILQKNKFSFVGNVLDPEDGDVWEWEYKSDNENEK